MVRGMCRRMDRSIGIDSVREGIVDSEYFGVLGCYLVAFIGNLSLGPFFLCLAKAIITSMNNFFAFNNREQPHQHQKPTRWSSEFGGGVEAEFFGGRWEDYRGEGGGCSE